MGAETVVLLFADIPCEISTQKAIGDYIVDFYCAKARLVVELDGSGHATPEQMQRDCVRTGELTQMNLTVFRVTNLDVDKNFRGVCERIDTIVRERMQG